MINPVRFFSRVHVVIYDYRTGNGGCALWPFGGRRGRDCMVLGFTTTCAISAYHH